MTVYRSYLFVPATKIEMVEKAIYSPADCIIIDLEDAVAVSEKESARENVKEALDHFKDKKDIFVRMNDIATPYWESDLSCAITNGAKGIIIPKVENAEGIQLVCDKVRGLIRRSGLQIEEFDVIPLIESAKGVKNVYDIAEADKMITKLSFGSIDFSLDIDCELTPEGFELLYARSKIVTASKAAGLESPVDAVFPDLKNTEGLIKEAEFVKQLGFKAKLIIHPKQIEAVHSVFSPSKEEVEKAYKIVTEFERAEKQGLASISVNNKMVDYPVYKKAQKIASFYM
ncbi:HpcH/HpaI aldolase/citrate lyase family protein [Domibacillus epiphyticus]|uniref:CoA ester lyase n=1 Tax=Domibacillus epiphyticus TaxID=1714355 RepID=A0A1V2A4W4_9BACI|nr:CoA ester lyase [Domibacillus epiphyticus]OMP65980.1 CoA ester lyase [Domibacillus epiphyticus]